MKNFKEYIAEAKNTHLEHLEDGIFNAGVNGTRDAINYLRALRDMLAGNSNQNKAVSIKWDGCVHEDTIILTNVGDMTIKEIVNREDLWGELEIIGKNLRSDIWPYDGPSLLIAGNSNEEGIKNWVEVYLADGTILKVTEDHLFHTTNRGWVEAQYLSEEDNISEL